MKAQQLLDEGSEGARLMVSVAKAKAGRAANLAVREGVQMHGGIGMTDEYDIGLYMKRDRALAEYMGDVHYHTDQVARRSEEHTSELQSLMRISYAVFCLKKKNNTESKYTNHLYTNK